MTEVTSEGRIRNYYRLANPMKELHLIREYPDCCFGVVINAHTGIYSPAVIELIKKHRLRFFIDPMTYPFNRNLSLLKKTKENGSEVVKKTFEQLLKKYGDWFNSIILEKINQNQSLTPQDFMKNGEWENDRIDDFTNNVLALQKNFIMDERQSTLEELQKLAGLEIKDTSHIKPEFLVAPYFYFEDEEDPWFNLSLKLLNTATKLKDSFELYGVLSTSKKFLLNTDLDKIIRDFDIADGILIWISGFNEYSSSKDEIDRYLQLIIKFKEIGKPVYVLYGGFFSAILSKWLLTGYCSGICYGESKNVDASQAVGGIPKRIYIRALHKQILVEYARRILFEKKNLLCNCKICKQIIKQTNTNEESSIINHYFTSMGKNESARLAHFIECRTKEVRYVNEHDLKGIIDELSRDIEKVKDIPSNATKHLRIWREILVSTIT